MDEDKPTLVFLGRDLLKIPCFRNAFLYSFSSYVGVGLATFLFTSKPRLSSHVGFAAFVVVTLGYYTDCRIKYNRTKLQIQGIQESLQKAAILEGTQPDTKSAAKLEEV